MPANSGQGASHSSPVRSSINSAVTAIATTPEKIAGMFRRRYPTVAITGMSGVGKTQLADRLTKRATPDVALEIGSTVMERRTRRSARLQGFRFLVVPGENAATRLTALDEVFHDAPVDGVVHVVANGYATPRRVSGGQQVPVISREEQLGAELEDWAITAHRIAAMAVRRDSPIWLVIAVNKTDLFPDEIDKAVDYYSPGSGSPFGNRIDELRALVGGAKLWVDVLPVSTQDAPVSGIASSALIDTLVERLGHLSGHS